MKWITLTLLWIVALVVALVVLRRVRRGKPVVLTGRWSPRVVRMVVVVLVVLGVGDEPTLPQAGAAPAALPIRTEDDTLPVTVTPNLAQTWLGIHVENGSFDVTKRMMARPLSAEQINKEDEAKALAHVRNLTGGLQKIVKADLAARVEGKEAKLPAADLKTALAELEKYGWFDHFWNAYLWRKSAAAEFANAADRIDLYARFRRHARITDALIRAHAQVKPLMQPPRAWMSKAGPRPEQRKAIEVYRSALTDMLKVANEVLPTTDEGTWKRDGVVLLKPVKDAEAPRLIRASKERVLPMDESTRFGRLDLLKTGDKPASVVHDWLGKIELPANRLISVWDLPGLLPRAAQDKLNETVLDAMKTNSEDASDRLERCLALSHEAIRVGLKELPMRKGAPRLRLILALFDDTVMPLLPQHAAAMERGVGGGPGRVVVPGGR